MRRDFVLYILSLEMVSCDVGQDDEGFVDFFKLSITTSRKGLYALDDPNVNSSVSSFRLFVLYLYKFPAFPALGCVRIRALLQ